MEDEKKKDMATDTARITEAKNTDTARITEAENRHLTELEREIHEIEDKVQRLEAEAIARGWLHL